MKERIHTKHSEKGVALLFSLGILGMMTVLALTFASVSMTNQTIAKNASEQLSARELARGLAERVRIALSENVFDSPQKLLKFYSKESATTHFDWLWKLNLTGTDLQSGLYRTDDDLLAYNTPQNLPTWQYIKDEKNNITARFAFIASAAYHPVLDLNNYILKEDGTAYTPPTLHNRLGNNIQELNQNLLFRIFIENRIELEQNPISPPTSYFSDSFDLAKLQTSLTSPVKRRTSWYSDLDFIYPKTGTVNVTPKMLTDVFRPMSTKYPEKFIKDGGSVDRYDLLGEIAKATTPAQKKALLEDIINNKKIPWLSDYSDSNASTEGYADSAHKAKQITANIIDFFSNVPESVSDRSWGVKESDIPPTYTGLRRTPYICGVGATMEITVMREKHADSEGKDVYTYKLSKGEVIPIVEVTNPMKLGGTCTIQMTGCFSYTLESGSGTTKTYNSGEIFSDTLIKEYTGAVTFDVNSSEYIKQARLTAFIPTPTDNVILDSVENSSETFKVKAVSFNPYRIALKWQPVSSATTEFCDYSRPEKKSGPLYLNGDATTSLSEIVVGDSAEMVTTSCLVAYRVADPRYNLFPLTWGNAKYKVGEINNTAYAAVAKEAVASFDTANSDPGGSDYSMEETAQTIYLPDVTTTPYDPQANPVAWHIGAIHRGAPWQTINLKKFNSATPTKGGTYEAGDAGLLDQIKLTSATETYGKIPLNELWDKNTDIIPALLHNTLKGTFSSSTVVWPNISIKFNDIRDGMANFFLSKKIKPAEQNYFMYRGELTELLTPGKNHKIYGLPDDLTKFKTDAALEEPFAKSVMLFDAEPTFLPRYVSVIGLVQIIKDTAGKVFVDWNGTSSITSNATTDLGKYNAGYRTGIASGADVKGAPTSGSPISASKGTYDNGADRILSEQKVFIVLEREYTSLPYNYTSDSKKPKWKIVRFEYVD